MGRGKTSEFNSISLIFSNPAVQLSLTTTWLDPIDSVRDTSLSLWPDHYALADLLRSQRIQHSCASSGSNRKRIDSPSPQHLRHPREISSRNLPIRQSVRLRHCPFPSTPRGLTLSNASCPAYRPPRNWSELALPSPYPSMPPPNPPLASVLSALSSPTQMVLPSTQSTKPPSP